MRFCLSWSNDWITTKVWSSRLGGTPGQDQPYLPKFVNSMKGGVNAWDCEDEEVVIPPCEALAPYEEEVISTAEEKLEDC